MTNNSPYVLLDAILRKDLAAFIAKSFETLDAGQAYLFNWHIELVADALTRAFRGEIKRLIITLPPRSLKSICASVAFPAWVLGHDPTRKIICASYAQDLAGKHARDCRTLMSSPLYRRVFPRTRLSAAKSAEEEFETTAGGYRLATSVGGTLTGRGGSILILDDAIKPQDALSAPRRHSANQWYDSTFYSRLNDKTHDVIIIVAQRVHVDDIVAHVTAKERWEQITLPAIAVTDERFVLARGRVVGRTAGAALHPAREPLASLAQTKATLGAFLFSAQYQQEPVPEKGNMVAWDWFRVCDPMPAPGPGRRIVQSWDTGAAANDGSDWSVCTTWLVDGERYHLIDVDRQRLELPGLKRRVLALRDRFGATTVLIEDAGNGKGLIQLLRYDQALYPIAIVPEGAKPERLARASAAIEAGQVLIPRAAPWLDTFKAEVLAFPAGRHDDQVDSLSQFLNWIARQRMVARPGIRRL